MSSRRDLKSWWKTFSRGNQKRDDEKGQSATSPTCIKLGDGSPRPAGGVIPFHPSWLLTDCHIAAQPTGIFGIPLQQSVRYANVAISLSDPETGSSYVYGYVPIVVAKCGVYLKEKGS
jgi:hypothetical protein